jgi:soluble lytic murein transglycosylase-like protein
LIAGFLLVALVGAASYQIYRTARTLTHNVTAWFAPAAPATTGLAPLFTPEVTRWESHILRWAEEYDVEPNLLATVMQIESCGHPTVNSYAGAQGLFQVMPFHFASTEDMLDPDTNAMRGINFLKQCSAWANGDVGLALACYNGGPSVLQMDPRQWDQQVHRYYKWGVPIYADALVHKTESETLELWLAAGGDRLCAQAAAVPLKQ